MAAERGGVRRAGLHEPRTWGQPSISETSDGVGRGVGEGATHLLFGAQETGGGGQNAGREKSQLLPVFKIRSQLVRLPRLDGVATAHPWAPRRRSAEKFTGFVEITFSEAFRIAAGCCGPACSVMITDVTVGGVQETSAEGSASKFTCYEVRTRLANGAEFVAWRRFSEFDRLHASLALNVPFACTKSFWGRFDDAVIAKRKAELECYVQTVLLACGGRALPALGSFLQLPVELHAQNDEVPASVFAGGSGELPPVAGEGGHPVAHVGRQGWMPQFGGREGQTPYGSPARGLPEFGGAGAQLGGAGSGAMSGGAFPPRVGSVRSDGASGPVGGMNSLLSLPTSAEEYEQRHEAIHNLATPAAPARQPELETKLDKLDNLVVVSMILPVRISRVDAGKDLDPEDDQGRAEGDYEWEIEFLAESLIGRQQLSHVIDDVGSVHWVGCPAWSSISAAESASLSDALEAVGCTALILPLEQVRTKPPSPLSPLPPPPPSHVLPLEQRAPHFAFCRKVLWPLLHNQSLHSAGRLDEPFSDEEWRAYCNVNKKMTDKGLHSKKYY
ncbi:hypothetical protein T492DRAFT_1140594 [Pavlovales sp. CCMP2436]|nr:hypothetical protein T492DRAFT_1140594 [Pavlovales sp. CCMP2436]